MQQCGLKSVIYMNLAAKETHIIQYPFYTRNRNQNTLNYMHMFVGTHAFTPGHFIHHYTVNYYAAKKQTNSAVHWKSHVLKPIALDVTTKQCNI